jgi:multidrug efflux pump subunit AcrA (membrane-fusion protein)
MPWEGFMEPNPQSTAPEGTQEGDGGAAGASQPQGFDAVLAGLDDSARAAVQAQLTKANNEAKTARQQLQAQKLAAQAATAATQTAEEQARAEQQANATRLQALLERSARSEIKALAADKFADPEDAAVYLKPSDFIDENGDVRSHELTAAIDELLIRKPHLAKAKGGSTTQRPAPDRTQGRTSGTAATEPRDVFAGWLQNALGRRPTS